MTGEAEFVMLQCENPNCRFRCPSNLTMKILEKCPICASSVSAVTSSFSNLKVAKVRGRNKIPLIEVLLDNLRSTLNVGSIFRTADGAGAACVHLCGTTPTPEHPKIAKTGLGAEWHIPWEYHRNGLDFVRSKQKGGFFLISLEAAPSAQSVFSVSVDHLNGSCPLLLVVGNEVSGIDPEILAASDVVCSIPMAGVKSSLNVAVAFGIAIYTIRELW